MYRKLLKNGYFRKKGKSQADDECQDNIIFKLNPYLMSADFDEEIKKKTD